MQSVIVPLLTIKYQRINSMDRQIGSKVTIITHLTIFTNYTFIQLYIYTAIHNNENTALHFFEIALEQINLLYYIPSFPLLAGFSIPGTEVHKYSFTVGSNFKKSLALGERKWELPLVLGSRKVA